MEGAWPDAARGGSLVARRRIVVRGVVQGVGFRPFVANLATELGVAGQVGNDEVSVFIEAEGPVAALDELTRRLVTDAPTMAVVLQVSSEDVPPKGDVAFEIVPSQAHQGARTLVPPDVATCDDCLAELNDPADRRYRHPFVTCTNCGPRLTIITDLPYDRPATTMAEFPLCTACQQEYDDPADRRYHAQPVSCHDCGPRLWLEGPDGQVLGDDAVLAAAHAALLAGEVLAVKGVGGFHLACDASNEGAVARLRDRKRRPHKPFAVMARDLGSARRIAHVSTAAEALLTQPSRPIVLLPSKEDAVAPSVAPALDEIGVMLPYTPLHHLLFQPVPDSLGEPPAVLVMTSGNLSDEPLCYDNDDARRRLADIADVFLLHDRPIAVPCEDSVVALDGDDELPVRRSRGYAPLPVLLDAPGPVTLAVGAEIKNTFCLTRQDFAFLSAHIGDMGTLESHRAFERSVAQLTALHDVQPDLLVADLHPGYATRRWAERRAEEDGTPLETVQHHHAHVVSLLAEHGRVGEPVIGLAYDGTGYGCDKHVWGGEILMVGEDVTVFERVGHLSEFLLAGGDAAVRNPYRVGLALLLAAGIDPDTWTPRRLARDDLAIIRSQLESGVGCAPTSSAGRLFDGVAALLGVRYRVSYEAQAAIELEALARTSSTSAPLTLPVDDGVLDVAVLVRELMAHLRSGTPVAALARGFHDALAEGTAEFVAHVAAERGVRVAGLTGGVFQNRLLLRGVAERLSERGLEVLRHRRIPPNDGGLSLGQAVVGRALAARR